MLAWQVLRHKVVLVMANQNIQSNAARDAGQVEILELRHLARTRYWQADGRAEIIQAKIAALELNTTNVGAATQAQPLPDFYAQVRHEYKAVRATTPCYPARVAWRFANILVHLRFAVESCPEMVARQPLIYGSDGALTAFAHLCAGQEWQKMLRDDDHGRTRRSRQDRYICNRIYLS